METFHWRPVPGMSVPTEPNVRVVKFGDGYEQRQPKGINNNLKTYSLTFRVPRHEFWVIDDFLTSHGGVDAFWWTPPLRYEPIKVVCRKWTPTINRRKIEISCEFEEVMV
ncbi:phage tail protein [Budviciaceae bacterium CWB-B4]|uniref:Phage tail protein n=1 Tax=Limnobaculum xujianqingii TaxID=2738837 RepID=A0A9D7AGA4_9GAMM|nr:phage tail protein [Limnobaculum xujianqingii]MBK5072235.1 phage tail protein [Limnobaculum xujianqingii]MBK5175544.1 phage tail protein [Limnobaculum xujianqingii]